MPERDQIFSQPMSEIADFAFDEKVAAVFPDMIRRSVPGYASVIAMTGVLAAGHAQPGSRCYDLGCSLGAGSFAICEQTAGSDIEVVAVDNSPAMLAECQRRLASAHCDQRLQLVCEDILNVALENASVVVMNYTLQFIEQARRDALIHSLYDALLPGGILLLSEKIRFPDAATDQRMIDMHHAFKKANGYSDLEISQKRTALENILHPETLDSHIRRLEMAGFERHDVWFQCFNFASLIACKADV